MDLDNTFLASMWNNITHIITPSSESSEIVQGLLELPVELLVSVSGYCTQKDIKRLCETCRMLRDAYTPELYRAIDLSSHNAEVACTTRGSPSRYNSDERLPPDFVAREWTPLDYVTFRKQQLLIQTILQKPDLGKYVRELCWTVLDTDSHSWRWYIQDEETYEYHGDWPDDVEPEKYEPEDEPMWRTFQTITNVSKVDICWIRHWREVTPAPPLFSSATYVRLSGCMTSSFVGSTLSPSNSRLQNVDLSNLLTWSAISRPPSHVNHIVDLENWVDEIPWDERSSEQGNRNYSFRLMIGALNPLINQHNLTTLRIGTLGNSYGIGSSPIDSRYHRLYESWARCLASMRGTLEVFVFDQDVHPYRSSCGTNRIHRSAHRDVDLLFSEWILPVLLGAKWARMKRVELKGIGEIILDDLVENIMGKTGDQEDVELFEERQVFGRLRDVCPDGVEINIEPKAGRMYEELECEDYGLPSMGF